MTWEGAWNDEMTTKGVNGIGQPMKDGHKNDRMAKE